MKGLNAMWGGGGERSSKVGFSAKGFGAAGVRQESAAGRGRRGTELMLEVWVLLICLVGKMWLAGKVSRICGCGVCVDWESCVMCIWVCG